MTTAFYLSSATQKKDAGNTIYHIFSSNNNDQLMSKASQIQPVKGQLMAKFHRARLRRVTAAPHQPELIAAILHNACDPTSSAASRLIVYF